jgi:hypothetical protein
VILWSDWNSKLTYAWVSCMYCSILITVSLEGDSNLHKHGCQVCSVPFWSQYHKKRIPTYISYVSWNSLLVILWSEWNSTYLTPLHMKVGILVLWYCDQNGTVHTWHPCICKLESSSEEDSNLHMQGCQVCTVPFWSQYHKKRIPTYICSGVRYVLFHFDHNITRRGFQLTYAGVSGMYCSILITVWSEWNSKNLTLESPSCDTVIRMEHYIPDTTAYAGWDPLRLILWSEWNRRRGF